MRKFLMFVLAFALVAGLTCAAYAEVQNVKVSGDINVIGLWRELFLQNNTANSNRTAVATITRVRVDADLTDNVMATVRLLNERYWGNESTDNLRDAGAAPDYQSNSDISLDLAYVTMKEFLYSPLTLSVGRQELHFGNDMIVGDPDTNNMASTASPLGLSGRDADLSARKAFDAIRATLNYDPLVVDLVMAKVSENNTLTSKDDNTDLYGINVGYAVNKNTMLEGYLFEKRVGDDASASATNTTNDRIDTVGARVVTQPITDLTYQLEVAHQFGRKVEADYNITKRDAWALETALNYVFKKVKYSPSLTALGAYFSGDKKNDSNAGWDPMFENQKFGDIANALLPQSNVILAGAVASAKPMDDVTLKGEYYAYFWDKKYNSNDTLSTYVGESSLLMKDGRKSAAQEVDLSVIYDYTEDVQFCLLGGVLLPGSSFSEANRSTLKEVIGSMKVTF